MKYLLISFCFLFVGCVSYTKKNNFVNRGTSDVVVKNSYFSDTTQDYVYKANIDLYKNNFGGIFIVKKIGDKNHRVVFTTEMGNKIFDFSFTNEVFKVNYILEDFNKKILINILEKDFRVLIEETPLLLNTFLSNNATIFETEINNTKHYYYSTNNEIHKIVRTKNGKEKVVFTFSKINDTIVNLIKISHKNLKLIINLKSI